MRWEELVTGDQYTEETVIGHLLPLIVKVKVGTNLPINEKFKFVPKLAKRKASED